MFFILCYSFISGVSADPLSPYTKYPPNTYRIASMMGTDLSAFNDDDAMNTILLQAALKINKLEYIKEATKNPKKIGQGIKLNQKTIDKTYPLEYLNLKDGKYRNIESVMAEILAGKLHVSSDSITFRNDLADNVAAQNSNTSKFAEVIIPSEWSIEKAKNLLQPYQYTIKKNNDAGEEANTVFTFDFNNQLYEEALKKSEKKDNLLIDAIVIKKNNTGFGDFLEANGLTKKAYLIQGYEIYKALDEANRFLQWVQTIQALGGYLILAFLTLALTMYIFERSNWKKDKILYFYGFPMTEIVRGREKSYLVSKLNLWILLTGILAGLVLFAVYESYFVFAVVLLYGALITLSCKTVWSGMKKQIGRATK